MTCPDCDKDWTEESAESPTAWTFCPYCGTRLISREDMEERRRARSEPAKDLYRFEIDGF